jgi:hypothetical protein
LYGQSRRAFSNVTVCGFKLSKLDSTYSGNATEASTWVDFISSYGQLLFIYYIIRCIVRLWCEYIIAGVGRLYVAYPYLEAMRRPEVRDRRERDITPTSFLFPEV